MAPAPTLPRTKSLRLTPDRFGIFFLPYPLNIVVAINPAIHPAINNVTCDE
jgi:hypothetical protein